MTKLTSSEKIMYFGKECHTPKSKEIIQAFNETLRNEKDIEQAVICLVIRAYESGYNEGSLNAVKAFVRDADKAPDISMQTYFEAYKKQIGESSI